MIYTFKMKADWYRSAGRKHNWHVSPEGVSVDETVFQSADDNDILRCIHPSMDRFEVPVGEIREFHKQYPSLEYFGKVRAWVLPKSLFRNIDLKLPSQVVAEEELQMALI